VLLGVILTLSSNRLRRSDDINKGSKAERMD